MGRDHSRGARDARVSDGKDPIALVLEWGVRQIDKHVLIRHSVGHDKAVRCDVFPAYDEDGGLLVAPSPRCWLQSHSQEILRALLTKHQKT